MEFLNKISIRGIVGRADISAFEGEHVAKFSVLTEHRFKGNEEGLVSEVTWFDVTALEHKDVINDINAIRRGEWVEVTGRVKMCRYVGPENEVRIVWEVVANKVDILPHDGWE